IVSVCTTRGQRMNVRDALVAAAGWFGCPLVLSWLLTALLIRWAPRLGLVDYPSARKVHTQPTPRAGGLAFFIAFVATSLLLILCHWPLAIFPWQLLLSAAIVLLGLLDDLRPLPWQIRLLVQFAVSAIAILICLPPASWPIRAAAVVWIAGL